MMHVKSSAQCLITTIQEAVASNTDVETKTQKGERHTEDQYSEAVQRGDPELGFLTT